MEEEGEGDSEDGGTISAAVLTGQVQELMSGGTAGAGTSPALAKGPAGSPLAVSAAGDCQLLQAGSAKKQLLQQSPASHQKQMQLAYQQRQLQLQQKQAQASKAPGQGPGAPKPATLMEDKHADSHGIDFEPPVIVSKLPGSGMMKHGLADKDSRVRSIDSRSESSSLKSESAVTPPKCVEGSSSAGSGPGSVCEGRRETPPARGSDGGGRMAASTPDNASKDSEGSLRGMEEPKSVDRGDAEESNMSSSSRDYSHLDQIINLVVEESRGWETKDPAEKDQMTELRSRERPNARRTSTSAPAVSTAPSSGVLASGVMLTAASPVTAASSPASKAMPHPQGHPLSGVTLTSYAAPHMSPANLATGVTMTSAPRHSLHMTQAPPHSNMAPQQHLMQQIHHGPGHVPQHQVMLVPQSQHAAHHARHPPPHAIQMGQHPHAVHTAYDPSGQTAAQPATQVNAPIGPYSMYSPGGPHIASPQQAGGYHGMPSMMQMHGSMVQTTVTGPQHSMPPQALQSMEPGSVVSQAMPMVSATYLQQPSGGVGREDTLLLKDLVEQEKQEQQRQRLAAEQQQQQQQFKMPPVGAPQHHTAAQPAPGEVGSYQEWGAPVSGAQPQHAPPQPASASNQESWMTSSSQGEDDVANSGP